MPSCNTAIANVGWVILLLAGSCEAAEQEEAQLHPWLYCNKNNPAQPCALGYFCTVDSGEIAGSVCEACPPSEVPCDSFEVDRLGVEECEKFCNFGKDGDPCSDDDICDPGNFFCDYQDGESGTCRPCSNAKTDCLAEELALEGKEDCLMSCDLNCYPIDFTSAFVAGKEINSLPLLGSPGLSASGPLVDCSNLIYEEETVCRGSKGSICLIQDETNDIYNFEMVLKCQENGGVAAILFGDYPDHDEKDNPFNGHLSFRDTDIPSITISYNDGIYLRANSIGSQTNVSVDNIGDYCWKDQSCSVDIPCIGQYEGDYCGYDWGDEGGWCWPCPTDDNGDPDPYSCFFDRTGWGKGMRQVEVESCAAKCAASLEFGTCKFCPQDVNAFDFGVEDDADRCYFCPENDVKYPNREVPFFGGGIMCWQMQSFFNRIEIHVDSQNCQLAQMMNYICGCEGPGYGGASNSTRKKVLVWLPRVMAFLSLLGSSFIIYDATRTKEKRETIFHQLMVVLSVFDLFGSLGYLFTSLPMPADDYVYGSHGNDKTCVAQGFFIQLGTISCYTNVSLAIYFVLATKMGWTERQIKKIRVLLFACPLLIGFGFTFAGIPFFDNMILWCNNTATWWPDIPVAAAIFIASVLMVIICFDVYSKEKASSRWRRPGESRRTRSLSNEVFWQSFWYIIAFYITWVPYLALQYMWATGKAFSKYGFILFAGTMVPLQGAWNFFVYIRPRYLKDISRRISRKSSFLASAVISSRLRHSDTGKDSRSGDNPKCFQDSSRSQETVCTQKPPFLQDSTCAQVTSTFHGSAQNVHQEPSTSKLGPVPEPMSAPSDDEDSQEPARNTQNRV